MIKNTEKKIRVRAFFGLAKTKVLLISLAHGINDIYASFPPTFMPFIKDNLGLSYAMAGSFNFIVGILHVVCQPVVGYLSDRMRRPFLIMLGPILCGLGTTMMPNMGSYWSVLFFAALWGLGSAIYHPQGTGGVGYVSDPEQIRTSLTYFNAAGTIGGAFGPLIAVFIARKLGYSLLPATVLLALAVAILIHFSMPFVRKETTSGENRKSFIKTIVFLFTLLYPFWCLATLRDLLFLSLRFFIPMKIAAQGGSLQSIGTVVFCLAMASTLGMMLMNRIVAVCGVKKAIKMSLLTGSGILFSAFFSPGILSIVLYILGLTCVYSTLPLTVMIAQELAPDERSAASTVVLGLPWGAANFLVLPVGKFADLFGIDAVLIFLAGLPLLGLALFLTPPFKMLKK